MSRAVIINQWPAAQIQPAKPSSPTCYLCQTRGAQIKSRTQQKQNTFVIHSFHSFFFTGKSSQVEKPWRPHGRTHDQRRPGDASKGWIHGRVEARGLERNLRLWRCLHSERDSLGADPWKTGQNVSMTFESTWMWFKIPDYLLSTERKYSNRL